MREITCIEAEMMMSDHIDGVLDQQDETAFSAHIANCPACREKAEQLLSLVRSLQEVEQIPVPECFSAQFAQALKNEVQTQRAASKPARRRFRAVSAAAAVIAVGLLSLAMFEDGLGTGIDRLSRNTELPSGEKEEIMSEADDAADGESASDGLNFAADTDLAAAEDVGVGTDSSAPQIPSGGTASEDLPVSLSKENTAAEKKAELFADAGVMEASIEETAEMEGAGPLAGGFGLQMSSVPAICRDQNDTFAAASSDGALSRGGSAHTDAKYITRSRDWMNSCAEAITEKDSGLFADIVAKAGINGYTTDTADFVLKFYQDYLGEGKLKMRLLKNDPQKMENVYLLEGSQNSTRFIISSTSAGLHVNNTILDHGPWLVQNAPEPDYILNGVKVRDKGKEVSFRFVSNSAGSAEENAETAGQTAEEQERPTEKEIVWKKTE